jgi:hypothetical protein
MTKAWMCALVLAAACGSKKSEPATSTTTSEPTGGSDMNKEMAEHHAEMAKMPPEIGQFHEVLAPRWHAEKGPQRMKDTCAALPEFHAGADALAKATPPTTANADRWTASTRQLTDAVTGLDDTCKANDATKFETAFEKVHVSFHGVMEQAGGEHEEHRM